MKFILVFGLLVLGPASWGQTHWEKVTHLAVEGDAKRSADVRVLMKSEGQGADLKCSFETEHQQFKNQENKWHPLPIVLVNAVKNDAPVEEKFKQSLSFPKNEKVFDKDSIGFQTTFRRGEFSFSSLWKFIPARQGEGAQARCVAKAELCAKIGFSRAEGRTVCLGEFKWIRQLVAIPHISNWLRGLPTDISGLRADYQYVDKQGKVQIDSVTYESNDASE